jgi:hypothetical protein
MAGKPGKLYEERMLMVTLQLASVPLFSLFSRVGVALFLFLWLISVLCVVCAIMVVQHPQLLSTMALPGACISLIVCQQRHREGFVWYLLSLCIHVTVIRHACNWRLRNRILNLANASIPKPHFFFMLSADETVVNGAHARAFLQDMRYAYGQQHNAYPVRCERDTTSCRDSSSPTLLQQPPHVFLSHLYHHCLVSFVCALFAAGAFLQRTLIRLL